MAEVLREHRASSALTCRCGEWRASRLTLTIVAFLDEHERHVAEKLAANGYGKLEDAWDEGYERGFWNGRLSELTVPYGTQAPLVGRNDAEANNPYRMPDGP